MKSALGMAGLVLAASMGLAWADDDCARPMGEWQPRDAVQRMAESQGWSVRRIRIDDGCYEVIGRDATGRAIEAKIDPGTLAVVELEYEDDHDDAHEERHEEGTEADRSHDD